MSKMAESEDIDEVLDSLTQTYKVGETVKYFTDRERLFVREYVESLSKTRAAEATASEKCPVKDARQSGYAFYNRPHVKNAIQEYFKATALEVPEMVKIGKKIAETNLADYYVFKDRIETTRKKVPLVLIIRALKTDLAVEQDYLMMLEADDPVEKTITRQTIKKLKRQIGRYESRLEKDPGACEMQYVDEVITEKVLNIDKLVEDRVPIKKVKYTERGMEVELYSTPESLEKLLRIAGAYEKDNLQKAQPVHILINDPLSNADDNSTPEDIRTPQED